MHGALADLAHHLDHIVRLDFFRREPARAVDVGMRHGPARIRLERQRLGDPARAEVADQRVVVALGGVRKTVKEAVHAFEHRARAEKAGAAEQRRADARLRRPAGMQPLGPGALGQIFDDAACHRGGGAERVDQLPRREFQRRADTGRRAHGAEHRGRMKARFVGERRRHGAQPAHGLDADGNAEKRGAAIQIVPLAGRQHRRHDDRAGMDRAAFECVVKIFAMDRGAVDQRCGGGRERARMTDGGARAIIVAAGQRSFHIVFVARRDGEADHVDQQILTLGPHRIGQARHIERANLLRQMLGNGGLGKLC